MAKKIIIIGAGMAGLSAGIHARRNNFEVELFEMHDKPGGLCTAWERKGYTFDGCIHWLVGSRPGSQFNRLWQEVCAIEEMEIVDHDIFMSIEGDGDKVLHIYSDIELLEEHLLAFSPEDEAPIRAITEAAGIMSRLKFPLEKPAELYRFWDVPPGHG